MTSRQLMAFESLLASKANANDPEFKPLLMRLRSEIVERLNNGNPAESLDFFVSSGRALSKLRGTAHSELRMDCAADICFFLISHGYPTEAIPLAGDIASLAKRTRNRWWTRKAENLSGLMEMDIGNISQAVVCFSRSWSMARELQDEVGQMSVLINLGAALNYGALYEEAIPCLHLVREMTKSNTAASACAKVGMVATEFECHALSNLAQSFFYLQRFDEAFEAISQCMAITTEPTDTHLTMSRVIREFTFVEIALEVGETSAAREHTLRCQRYGRGQGRRAAFLAEICRGLCEAYDGNPQLGVEILQAIVNSPDLADSSRQPALLAVVRACEKAGREETALGHMHQLLDNMRSKREKDFRSAMSLLAATPITGVPNNDLQPLRLKEAQLRAIVAERKMTDARIEMLERLAVTADLKEEQSGEHGYRVGKISCLLAELLNWGTDARGAIELAARLHDIGKVGVPDPILLKSKQLRDAEREMMSIHPVIGAELLAKSDIPQLRMAEDIARYHHEWWDGTGYPAKLKGKRIPIHARIVALADVFDALTHGRPYAPAWPIEKALEEIHARRGTQFDPELTDRFIELVQRLQKEHPDLDEYLGKAGRNSPFAQARNRIRVMLEEGRERIDKQVAPASETVH